MISELLRKRKDPSVPRFRARPAKEEDEVSVELDYD
jgi:hypothetical protein